MSSTEYLGGDSTEYLRGEETGHGPTEYVSSVLDVVEAIPVGRVMSYGAIADYLAPRYEQCSPRRVGTIMSLHGSAVPWHRVVNAAGRLPPGHEERARRLLEGEGVTFRGAHVDMAAHAWFPGAGQDIEAAGAS